MNIFSKLFNQEPAVDCHELVQNGAALIDVRTPEEFNSGHIEGSTNVPLDRLPSELNHFKSINKPIVLVCRSGMRSGKATSILKNNGIEQVHNGGSWTNFSN